MRTETLVIAFTDIKGYTEATSAQTLVQNARLIKTVDTLVAPVVRAFDGNIVKSIGDAYMITFRSPTEAVRCAIAIQDRIAGYNTENREKKPEGIHLRIALNVGEVRVHRGDVFGEPVNVASRIESVTPADEIYVSESVYLTMNRSDLPLAKVGDFELKGVTEPVTLYRVEPRTREGGALPFGGLELSHFRRMRWLHRASRALWILAVCGLSVAAWMRYRPQTDYGPIVAAAKLAVEQGRPMDAIATAGQIPETAITERSLARRYRRMAASQLFDASQFDASRVEVDLLLSEDSRDAEALFLRGLLMAKREEYKTALGTLQEACRLNPVLALRQELLPILAKGYGDKATRRIADTIVEEHIKNNAVPMLQRLVTTSSDRNVKQAAAARLEKLGAGQEIDWVELAIEDLKSTNCKQRKAAIARLISEGDERAVGPLMRVAESKGCEAKAAQKAAETIIAK